MREISIVKEHAIFLASMFITILTSQATMVVDASVGGNLLGTDAVSAVNLVMPVYELFYALVMMLGMGGCTIASMCLGRGDMFAVRKHFTAAVTSSAVIIILMGIGILVYHDKMVELLCGDSYLYELTRDYLEAMVPYFVIAGVSMTFMLFTAMTGRPVLVMWCVIMQFIVNITSNILLIKVAGMGIEALAYSSALASGLTLLMLLTYYHNNECPFRIARCSFREFWSTLGCNVRYGGGYIAVNLAYMTMAYSMNSLVLRLSGEDGMFLWSVVMMIYLTGDYASAAAQETSLSLGGRLLGKGDRSGFKMVYNRSLIFALVWIGLILVAVFAFPSMTLPLFGVTGETVYPSVLRTVALAIPFIVGVNICNLFLVRLVQQDKVVIYALLSWMLYMTVPVTYLIWYIC